MGNSPDPGAGDGASAELLAHVREANSLLRLMKSELANYETIDDTRRVLIEHLLLEKRTLETEAATEPKAQPGRAEALRHEIAVLEAKLADARAAPSTDGNLADLEASIASERERERAAQESQDNQRSAHKDVIAELNDRRREVIQGAKDEQTQAEERMSALQQDLDSAQDLVVGIEAELSTKRAALAEAMPKRSEEERLLEAQLAEVRDGLETQSQHNVDLDRRVAEAEELCERVRGKLREMGRLLTMSSTDDADAEADASLDGLDTDALAALDVMDSPAETPAADKTPTADDELDIDIDEIDIAATVEQPTIPAEESPDELPEEPEAEEPESKAPAEEPEVAEPAEEPEAEGPAGEVVEEPAEAAGEPPAETSPAEEPTEGAEPADEPEELSEEPAEEPDAPTEEPEEPAEEPEAPTEEQEPAEEPEAPTEEQQPAAEPEAQEPVEEPEAPAEPEVFEDWPATAADSSEQEEASTIDRDWGDTQERSVPPPQPLLPDSTPTAPPDLPLPPEATPPSTAPPVPEPLPDEPTPTDPPRAPAPEPLPPEVTAPDPGPPPTPMPLDLTPTAPPEPLPEERTPTEPPAPLPEEDTPEGAEPRSETVATDDFPLPPRAERPPLPPAAPDGEPPPTPPPEPAAPAPPEPPAELPPADLLNQAEFATVLVRGARIVLTPRFHQTTFVEKYDLLLSNLLLQADTLADLRTLVPSELRREIAHRMYRFYQRGFISLDR